jgi:hypothetical protein
LRIVVEGTVMLNGDEADSQTPTACWMWHVADEWVAAAGSLKAMLLLDKWGFCRSERG